MFLFHVRILIAWVELGVLWSSIKSIADGPTPDDCLRYFFFDNVRTLDTTVYVESRDRIFTPSWHQPKQRGISNIVGAGTFLANSTWPPTTWATFELGLRFHVALNPHLYACPGSASDEKDVLSSQRAAGRPLSNPREGAFFLWTWPIMAITARSCALLRFCLM